MVSAKAALALGRLFFCMRRKRWGRESGSDSEPSPCLEAGNVRGSLMGVGGEVVLVLVLFMVSVVSVVSMVAPPRWRMDHGLRIVVVTR